MIKYINYVVLMSKTKLSGLGCFLSLMLFFSSAFTSAQTVVLPGNEREDYITEILTKALSYSPDKNYQLGFINVDIPKIRAFHFVSNNDGIDVIAAGATKQREEQLLAIKFPLYKGLYGWRIPLVKKSNLELFANINSIEQLQKISIGQLHSWSDTKILEYNSLNVIHGSDYKGLFQMLNKSRFDALPRSVFEFSWELNAHKSLDLAIDPYILLHYPTAYFFYVNKSNLQLADDIAAGLEKALLDGSFEAIFMRHHGDIIKQVQSENRRIFHLSNPFLSIGTPLDRENLWVDFTPQS